MSTCSKKIVIAAMAAAVLTVLAAGCGGGGGGGTTTSGSVTGRIVDLASEEGIENTVVVIGGRQGASTTNGAFTVSNIPPGVYPVTVLPTEFFIVVGDVPDVPVTANQTYDIGTILVVNPLYVPPTPP